MHTPRTSRALAVVVVGMAGVLAPVMPAGASEGQPVPPPPPPLPWTLTPPTVQAGPVAPPKAAAPRRPRIRGARVVPRRVRSGRRAVLRLSLSRAGRVRVTVTRMSRPHRGRVTVLRRDARSGRLSIRLPRAAHGRALARGRYRVTIVVVDARGMRSRTVRRSFVVR